jgi:hypothetical protein
VNDGNERQGSRDELGNLDKLDSQIEQALGSYTAREPRAGLEQRILSHVAAVEAERARTHGWGWKPAWALAAAMALMAVVAIPVWYRPVRPETAVVHTPEIRRPAAAEVGHPSQAAPLTARAARTTRYTFTSPLTPYGRVAAAEPEVLEIAAKTSAGASERATNAPVDDKPPADESATLTPAMFKPAMFKPIELKPITIAPIQIAVLN